MSFRKRNAVIRDTAGRTSRNIDKSLSPGLRPSPLDGRLTTSTGTASLDQLLTGHWGMPLGSSLLIEEPGTTDFGGAVLRYFAAEGLVQGHEVHVLGFGNTWRQELPGLSNQEQANSQAEHLPPSRMKIAWRYGALGNPETRPGKESSILFA